MKRMTKWTSETPRLMAVDESGTSRLYDDEDYRTEENRWIVISGAIFSQSDNEDNIKKILDLKSKYWANGMFRGERIVFHGREINKGIGAFSKNVIDREAFIDDLCVVISELQFEVASICIDKHKHYDQYYTPNNPYFLAYKFLLERFCMTLKPKEHSSVLNESRGKTEDKKLYNLIKPFLDEGEPYISDKIHQIDHVYFNSKLTSDKKKSHFMLEIADLSSYTLHRYLRDDISTKLFQSFRNKYIGGRPINGHNYKIFPKECYKEWRQ
ncbi:DUF3800 domain-containing protein [Leuconostoc pseudomesenteroides]|uniref:DUF3800 domain-containing protein n=1 Tax=Leuconostoc pseudomesenteroides TaxID=33968 RepID=UPI002285D149|nr:DUF3800 domain-containing protein [Leuconostoc pseudomesenteroides]WAM37819.1 DUF3800 domain-containing protein [Leuconostoc pseudomesenteroides]